MTIEQLRNAIEAGTPVDPEDVHAAWDEYNATYAAALQQQAEDFESAISSAATVFKAMAELQKNAYEVLALCGKACGIERPSAWSPRRWVMYKDAGFAFESIDDHKQFTQAFSNADVTCIYHHGLITFDEAKELNAIVDGKM